MERMPTTNIFETLAPQLKRYVLEVIHFMNGIPSERISPRDQLVKQEHIENVLLQTDNIVSSIIDNCKRKKTLGYVINEVMSRFQYANMAGFNLLNLFGEFRPIYQGNQEEIKEQWHNDMTMVLTETLSNTILPGTISISRKLVVMCEEYDINALPNTFSSKDKKKLKEIQSKLENMPASDPEIADTIKEHYRLLSLEKNKNTNPNEFETIECNPDGSFTRLTKEALNENIFHNYNIFDDKLLVNIHNGSNMKGPKAIDSITNLITKFKMLFPQRHLIICGDSNIYYSKHSMEDVTTFATRMKELGFNLLISRYVVTKRRPRNFFQNSQSAEKGFEENIEDTMFIAYPICLQGRIEYDSQRYFIVSPDMKQNNEMMFQNTIWAFEGASLGFHPTPEHGWEGINICNYHEYLFSDHMPIYCDIDGIRLVVANNVSVMGSRGINYNQDKFKKSIKLNNLEEISDKVLMPYFISTLQNLIESFIVTESGNPILKAEVIKEYNEILRISDEWEMLKRLTTISLC